MAANDSLQNLSALQSIEIRAYTPNEDMLLEMVGGDTRTICWRAPGSHDLVIKDLTGACKFCVGGTEIKNHPISVYYREGQTIGTIESNKLKLTGEDSTEDISTSAHQFTVAGNRIQTFPTHITISFNQQAAVEMKAMVIAFTIQQALAYDFLQRNLPAGVSNIKDIPTTSVVPKQNKHATAVFTDEDNHQTYQLKLAGPLCGTNYSFLLFWMDNSKRHDILLTAVAEPFKVTVTNVIGEEEFRVEVADQNSIFSVFSKSTRFGQMEVGQKETADVLTTESSGPENKMYVKGTFTEGNVVDSAGSELAKFKNVSPTTEEITFIKLTRDQKILLSAYLFFKALRVLRFARRSAQFMVTMLTCNCASCEQPGQTGKPYDRMDVIDTLKDIPKLIAIVVGHNTAKNLIYLNVFHVYTKKTLLTLECTPLEKFQGLAKLVVKEAYGRIIFNAVALPDDVLAIYSHEDKLLGYHYNGHAFDDQNTVTMIAKVKKPRHRAHRDSNRGERVECKIFDYKTKGAIAHLQRHHFHVVIHQPDSVKESNLFRMGLVMALAAKLAFGLAHHDLDINPEISYRYKGCTDDAKRICRI